MPVIQIDVEKVFNGEYWTNVYHVNAAGVAAAMPQALIIKNAERNILPPEITITKYRVSDMDPNTDNFNIVQVNEAGSQDAMGGSLLPLFNCVRVDFNAASGRPGRKYLRGVFSEAQQTNAGDLSAPTLAAIKEDYIDLITENTDICKADGTVLVDGFALPQVAMRQLRRGSKRRTQPVL